MFPYTCLATMPLFCQVDWPRKFENFTIISKIYSHLKKWKFNVKLLFKKMFFASAKDNQRKNDDNDENHDTSDKILQQDNYVANNEIQNLKIINKPREENFDDYSNETINFKLPLNKDCLNQQERKKKSELVRSKSFYENKNENVSKKKKFVIFLLIFHIGLQCFLPYSHFITQVIDLFIIILESM